MHKGRSRVFLCVCIRSLLLAVYCFALSHQRQDDYVLCYPGLRPPSFLVLSQDVGAFVLQVLLLFPLLPPYLALLQCVGFPLGPFCNVLDPLLMSFGVLV